MNYLITLLSGVLIAVMIAANGELTAQMGVYLATVMIHIIGLILISPIVWVRKEKPFSKRYPWYLYLGGALGVLITAFNSVAFGRISVSAILALSLLGQSLASIVVDHFGLLGMEKHPLKKSKLLGIVVIGSGIAFMITDFELLAVLFSFSSGILLVMSRILNGKLAEKSNVMISTFFNYVIGLLVALLAMAMFNQNGAIFDQLSASAHWFAYLGGAIGIVIVLGSNVVVAKIPAFYMTLFLFIGQVFSGLLIDKIMIGEFSTQNLQGVSLVAIGLLMNLLLDKGKKQNGNNMSLGFIFQYAYKRFKKKLL